MIYRVIVPRTGDDVEEVRVLQWHRSEGQEFAAGDLLVELETHKAIIEYRPDRPGVLRRVLCAEGEWQRIGKPLALLSDTITETLPEDAGATAQVLDTGFEAH